MLKNWNETRALRKTATRAAYQKHRKLVGIVSLAVVAALFVLATVTVGKPLVELASDPDQFREWVDGYGMAGRLILAGMMTLQVIIAMIPGEVIEIAAGYAFGAVEGTALVLIGAAAGSAIIFFLTKCFGIKLVEAFVSREKINQIKFIKDEKKLHTIVFLAFFIPGTPKDLLTYFVGLTPMKLGPFLLLSTIARIPSVITSTIGGNAIGMQDYTFAVLVFSVTALVSLIGVIFYRIAIRRRAAKNTESKEKETDTGVENEQCGKVPAAVKSQNHRLD